ncbi:M50 family metallopeptidase [Cellulomonas marina]|uniref:Peptidase M50B-like n=1 Tax=Cellulomonas marina TaxID=988821 RepID=A0A1I0XWS2_9CELL|nr:M50 family metallopeptidase [Cellulomonas marina]GIG28488.1 membrane protein [Cellulomonas marina]SFB05451.1 Peptidase M50B-like [Cellulomonas marina]
MSAELAAVPRPALGLAVAALVVLVVSWGPAWRVARHGVTLVHEAAHGAVALLVGRRLAGIRLHSDTSGLTVSAGRPRGPGMVATLLAGYPGPALVGLAAARVLAEGRAALVLWKLLVVVVLVLLVVRNLFGLWTVLVAGGLLVAVTQQASPEVQGVVAHALTGLLLLGSVRAVVELGRSRRRLRGGRRQDTSDAGQLAGLTGVPGTLWVALFGLVCVGCTALAATWLWAAATA